jgi:hypothetical protein
MAIAARRPEVADAVAAGAMTRRKQMRKRLISTALVVAGATALMASAASAAGVGGAALASGEQVSTAVEKVARVVVRRPRAANFRRVKPGVVVVRPAARHYVYRYWRPRPHYGLLVGGITLGTIIALSAPPAPPQSDLCWYWANRSHTRGYWDYCY